MTCSFARSAAGMLAATLLVSCGTVGIQRRVAELEPRLTALAAYDYGADRAPAVAFSDYLTQHRSKRCLAAFEPRLVAFAQDESATRASRQLVIRELGRIGTKASVPALIDLLAEPRFADDAATALTRIEGPDVLRALRTALASATDETRTRLIVLLGRHRDPLAVRLIAPHLHSKDPATAEAAVVALGRIATIESTKLLADAAPWLEGGARTEAWNALLASQADALAHGNRITASIVARAFEKAKAPPRILAASKRVMLRSAPPKKVADVAAALLSSDDGAHQAAGAMLARLQADASALLALSGVLDTLPPASQIALLGLLEDRALAAASPKIVPLAFSTDLAVQRAALHALRSAGLADSVDVLVSAMTAGPEQNRGTARDSLSLITGAGVEKRLLGHAENGPAAARAEVLGVIGKRGMTAAMPVVLSAATDTNAVVREAAVRQLGALAGRTEWPQVLDLLEGVANDKDGQSLVTAAASVGTRVPDAGAGIASRLSKELTQPARIALLDLAGRLSDNATLPEITRAAGDEQAAVRLAALRALGNWQTPAALQFLKFASSGDDKQARRLAQRGALQVIRRCNEDANARVVRYREIAPLIEHADEQRMLLSDLGKLSGSAAFALAAELLNHEEVRSEAEAAAVQIAKRSGALDETMTTVLRQLSMDSQSAPLRNEAAALLGQQGGGQ